MSDVRRHSSHIHAPHEKPRYSTSSHELPSRCRRRGIYLGRGSCVFDAHCSSAVGNTREDSYRARLLFCGTDGRPIDSGLEEARDVLGPSSRPLVLAECTPFEPNSAHSFSALTCCNHSVDSLPCCGRGVRNFNPCGVRSWRLLPTCQHRLFTWRLGLRASLVRLDHASRSGRFHVSHLLADARRTSGQVDSRCGRPVTPNPSIHRTLRDEAAQRL
jgi:hypothetical protein